jgi:hypothetical protein
MERKHEMRRLIHAARPQPAMIVALIALVFAAGGTSYAALQLTGSQIKNETITSLDIKNKSLKIADLSPSARATLKGNEGKRGPAGPVGPQGAPGSAAKLPGGLMWIDHFSFPSRSSRHPRRRSCESTTVRTRPGPARPASTAGRRPSTRAPEQSSWTCG